MIRIILLFSVFFINANLIFAQWQKVAQLPTVEISALEIIDSTFYAGYDSLVYISTDGGNSWQSTNPFSDSTEYIQAITYYKGNLYAGTLLHGIFSSTDNGLSWNQINSGLGGLGALSISSLVIQKDRLITGTQGAGTFILNNDMKTWSSFGDLPWRTSGTVFSIANRNDTLFAGAGINGQFYKLSPDSDLWEEINFTDGSLVPATGFTWMDDNIYIATTNGIYFSTDNGNQWIKKKLQTTTTNYTLICHSKGNLYAMLVKQGVSYFYYSTDKGETWSNDEPIIPAFTYSIKTFGNKIYTAREDGLWYREINTTSVEEENFQPAKITLYQNYPNPFNPVTIIKYSLPGDTRVRLSLYSITGEMISEIVNTFQKAGTYELNIGGNNLASGIYFCRLYTDKYPVKTIKMILLK